MTNRHCFQLICVALLSIDALAQIDPTPEPTTPAAQVRLGNDYLGK